MRVARRRASLRALGASASSADSGVATSSRFFFAASMPSTAWTIPAAIISAGAEDVALEHVVTSLPIATSLPNSSGPVMPPIAVPTA